MPAGIRVINQATGSVQIDETYFNMEYVEKIIMTTGNPDPPDSNAIGWFKYSDGFSYVRLPVYDDGSIVFFDSAYYTVMRGESFLSGLISVTYVFNAPVGTQVTAYRFTKPNQTVTEKQGLIIYNASSEVCFNSNKKPLVIADIVTGSNYRTAMPAKTYPTGRTYALAQGGWAGHSFFEERDAWLGDQLYRYKSEEQSLMTRMNGNSLQSIESYYMNGFVIGFRSNYGNNFSRNFDNFAYVLLVADVTGY